jgi:hypothetical protein
MPVRSDQIRETAVSDRRATDESECPWAARHDFAHGVIGTGQAEAQQELKNCIRTTLRKVRQGGFQLTASAADHTRLCAEIELSNEQTELIHSGIIQTDEDGKKTLSLKTKTNHALKRKTIPL